MINRPFFITLSIFLFFPTLLQAKTTRYEALLGKVTSDQGVKWTEFKAEEKKALENVLKGFADARPETMPPDTQLAFWINAHNACVMKLISDHMPIEDVMTIEGFRDRLTCNIAGTPRTIVDIESRVIRPTFKNPKVLFALWWGVKGGPDLLSEPYDGEKLKLQLEMQTKKALQKPTFLSFSDNSSEFKLSQIFEWYKTDFGNSNEAVLSFVRKHLAKETAEKLPKRAPKEMKYTTFNWQLDAS